MFKSSIHCDEMIFVIVVALNHLHPTATFIHIETNYQMFSINSVKVSMLTVYELFKYIQIKNTTL